MAAKHPAKCHFSRLGLFALPLWAMWSNEDLSIFRASEANARWPELFGKVAWSPGWQCAFLGSRIALTTLFAGHLLLHVSEHWNEGYYLAALTNWTLAVQVLYFYTGTLTTWKAQRREKSTREPGVSLPRYAKIHMILMYVAVPGSILVAIGFWPFVAVGLPGGRTVQYLTVFTHGADAVLSVVDLRLSGIPFHPRYGFFLMAYLFVFASWTLLHFAFKVGTKDGCRQYEEPERCPIYTVLDWHRPLLAAACCFAAVFVAAPLATLGVWACSKRMPQSTSVRKELPDASKSMEDMEV